MYSDDASKRDIFASEDKKKFLSKITKCRQTTSAVILEVFKKFTAPFAMLNIKTILILVKLHTKQLPYTAYSCEF